LNIKPTYGNILSIAGPIMLFMFVQNLIGLTDMIFLGRVGLTEFSACGLMSTFYLFLMMIGFGISRGAQILIARRLAQNKTEVVGQLVDQLFIVEMVLAVILFLFVQFGSHTVLPWFVQDPDVFQAGWTYLDWRSYGIFFSLFGFVLLALYSGIGRTGIIVWIALVLAGSNVFLNYSLIFGKFGLPEMGIAGAGLASSISEALSAVAGIIYLIFDPIRKKFGLFTFTGMKRSTLRRLSELSTPLVLQNMVGVGGWFAFIAFIENMGKEALAISVALKAVYTFYSIPSWGIASAVNSVVSNAVGLGKFKLAMLGMRRSTILSIIMTAFLSLTLLVFPEWITSIFTDDPVIFTGAAKLFWLLIVILMSCSVSVVVLNGMMGAGAVKETLYIEAVTIALYLLYAYAVINWFELGLAWAWGSEFIYWTVLLILTLIYMRTDHWKTHSI